MTMIGADLIAKGLAAYGVEHVFAIVSIHNMPILDAINRLGETAIIDVRHEQAGTHAADGYARATGRMGYTPYSMGNSKSYSRPKTGSVHSPPLYRGSRRALRR